MCSLVWLLLLIILWMPWARREDPWHYFRDFGYTFLFVFLLWFGWGVIREFIGDLEPGWIAMIPPAAIIGFIFVLRSLLASKD